MIDVVGGGTDPELGLEVASRGHKGGFDSAPRLVVTHSLTLLPGPTAALREYIASQLNQELAQLRVSVEQRLAVTEEQFNTKLAQLEKSGSGKGSAKGKKK